MRVATVQRQGNARSSRLASKAAALGYWGCCTIGFRRHERRLHDEGVRNDAPALPGCCLH